MATWAGGMPLHAIAPGLYPRGEHVSDVVLGGWWCPVSDGVEKDTGYVQFNKEDAGVVAHLRENPPPPLAPRMFSQLQGLAWGRGASDGGLLKKAAAAAASITLLWLKFLGCWRGLGACGHRGLRRRPRPLLAFRASACTLSEGEAAPRADCPAAVWRPPLLWPQPGSVDPRPLE